MAAFIRAHGPRYIGFAGVDPWQDDAVAQFDHAVTNLGLRGLNLQCFELKLTPDDPRLFPLYEKAIALNVPVNYFFEGLQQVATPATPGAPANDRDLIAADVLSQKETLELVRAYYKLGERPRRRLLDLAKALQDESTDAA